MKNKQKRIILIGSLCVLLSAAVFGFTVSYLTDSESADNIFTLGNIHLTLIEPGYPSDAKDRVMVPYKTVCKDPRLVNSGTKDAFVFIKLTVPLDNAALINNDRSRGAERYQEIFKFGVNMGVDSSTSGNVTYNKKWVLCYDETDTEKHTHTYVFGYSEILKPQEQTSSLFDTVSLLSILEKGINSNLAEDIIVEGYGIQSENILDSTINTTQPDSDNLFRIYSIIENQRG